MAQEVLIYLSLIISISAALTILARAVKQPPIIAYLLAGVIVGPLVLNLTGSYNASSETLQTFSRIGVAFLLFIVGLNLDFRLFKEIGKVSAISGIAEMLLVGFAGFWVSTLLGFSNIAGFYIGAAIAFSSTVVVVKILSDKKEMDTLHGRISLGILIIQDIVAAICLMAIPLLTNHGEISTILTKLLLAVFIIAAIIFISGFVFNRFLNYLARSQEALFIFGVAWALILATIFHTLGFSIEIGALVAGVSLASTKYALDLSGKMKPLRDFFIVLFFVFFGSQLTGPITPGVIKNALIFSLLVMILKPFVIMASLKFLGYTKKTNFFTSISLAQVSEFSLILIMIGFNLGHVSIDIMNIAVLMSLVTIGISAYTINASHYLSQKLSWLLDLFEGKISQSLEKSESRKNYDILLFGYHRIGYKLIENVKKTNKSFAVIDYNPNVIADLARKGIPCFYGDASNMHFLSEIGLEKTKLIISTIPDENTNLNICEILREYSPKTAFIATAEHAKIAVNLYKAGIDYVIIPHHLGGEYASNLIAHFGLNKRRYKIMGKEHKKHLESGKRGSTFFD